jgi:hypothetical protein
MDELSNEQVATLAAAVNLNIQDPDLTQVAYCLNAILEAMGDIDVSGLNAVEPLPIIAPATGLSG